MNSISFTLDMEPPTVTAQQQKTTVRHGLPCRYDTPELKAAKRAYATVLAPHKPDEPLKGALSLEVTFVHPYRKSEPLKNRGELIPKDTRPDTDNMVKALKDQMERSAFFVNDSQIYRERVTKYWGAYPCIYVTLERYED